MNLAVYYDKDADLGLLGGKTVAIIGYGSQGHAHAQNLHDSGVRVIVGLRSDSPSVAKAEAAGLDVKPLGDAARQADIIMMLLPDEHAPAIYAAEIAPNLSAGNYLAVSHGFNFHFGQIRTPEGVNVFMVAPKGVGPAVRAQYVEGRGVPALVAVHEDPSGDTLQIALAYAKGIGAGRAGIIKTTFREETETDLFGEQVVLCGGLTALMTAGFETLVEAGYPAELAYFETIHEVKLIVDLVYAGGIASMGHSISNTAEYGGLTRGQRVITAETKARMKTILHEIQSGAFAKEFMEDTKSGSPRFEALRREVEAHPLEGVGAELRGLMPWLAAQKPAGRSKN